MQLYFKVPMLLMCLPNQPNSLVKWRYYFGMSICHNQCCVVMSNANLDSTVYSPFFMGCTWISMAEINLAMVYLQPYFPS